MGRGWGLRDPGPLFSLRTTRGPTRYSLSAQPWVPGSARSEVSSPMFGQRE